MAAVIAAVVNLAFVDPKTSIEATVVAAVTSSNLAVRKSRSMSAATVAADSSVKNSTLSQPGLRPSERAWFSSKNTTIRSFHLTNSMPMVTALMITTCRASSSEMPRMLPSAIDWMLTDVGLSDAISIPAAKKAVNTMPITASSRSFERERTSAMPSAARRPARNAPTA